MDWTGNKNSIYKTLGASNHTENEREKDDYYATDPIAVDKLLSAVELPQEIWECACGAGHLSERLIEHGKTVFSSDLRYRGYDKALTGANFLETTPLLYYEPCAIVTNPPYKYAKEFVEHALELLKDGDLCCMFLKLSFLEGKARKKLFVKSPPRQVLVFSERILCAKNGEFERMKAGGGSAVAYAWFVWEKGYTGKTTIEWI